MKKCERYLRILPFIICLVCLVIYLVYVIHIKLHPSIVVTDPVITTLKVLLIIALISLFIGLFIILLRKINRLADTDKVVVEKTIVTNEEIIPEDKIVVTNDIKSDVVINEKVKKQKNSVISEVKKEEKIIVKEENNKKLLYVSCPECDGLISEKAALCPHCGIIFDREVIRLLKKYDKQKEDDKRSYGIVSTLINLFIIIFFIILIILVSNVLIDRYNKTNPNSKYNTEEKQ